MIGIATVVVLAIAGLPLAMLLAGLRGDVVFMAPLFGASYLAAAAAVVVGSGGAPLLVMTLALAAGFAAPIVVVARRRNREWRIASLGREALTVGAPVLALAWALIPLAHFRLGWDGRSIWLLHARLLYTGHSTYLAHAHAFPFSHPDYPPLTSSAVAFDWLMRGSIDYRDGQMVIALLTASATALAAIAVARATAGSIWLRALVTVVVVLVLYGVWGTYATNGYVDPLLTALVLAAAAYGLLGVASEDGRSDRRSSPPDRLPLDTTSIALALVVAGSLVKNEGVVYGLILVALIGGRAIHQRRHGSCDPSPRPATLIGVVLLMAVWPVVVHARGISSSLTHGGSSDRVHRLHLTLDALRHGVGATAIGLAGLAVAAVAFRALRARAVLFLAAIVLVTGALVTTYTFGPDPIEQWLATSIDRTDMVIRAAGFVAAILSASACIVGLRIGHSPAAQDPPSQ